MSFFDNLSIFFKSTPSNNDKQKKVVSPEEQRLEQRLYDEAFQRITDPSGRGGFGYNCFGRDLPRHSPTHVKQEEICNSQDDCSPPWL